METDPPAADDDRSDELLRRFRQSRSPEDFAALFDGAAPRLFRAAVRLTRDGARAEDVLQETFLAVLVSVDSYDPGRPAGAWLMGVLQRKAADAWRARERDARPLPRPAAASPDPGAEASRNEDLARIRSALEELPEPYRRVAVLRWRYGLEPGEIADSLGEAPGTVRSLLSRARDRLERTLRAAPMLAFLGSPSPRGLEAVRGVLLREATRLAAPAAAGAALGGALVIGKPAAAVAAGVAVLLGITGWWVLRRPEGRAPAARPPEVTRVPPVEAGAPLPASAAGPRMPAVPDGPCRLAVGVVDGTSRPVPGASLDVFRRPSPSMGGDDIFQRIDSREAPPSSRAGPTDAEGRAVLRLPEGGWTVQARAEGFASAASTVDLVEGRSASVRLVLWPACSLEGTVLSAPGRPRPGGLVLAFWNGPVPEARARVDGEGRFRLTGLPPGRHHLMAVPRPGTAFSAGVVQVPGADRIEILLPDGLTVKGRVLDAATGTPVEGAEVALSFGDVYAQRSHETRAATGSDGAFRFEDLPPGRIHGMFVRREGYLPWPDGGTGPGPGPDVEVRLRRGSSVHGRVTLPDGTPVPGAAVSFLSSIPRGAMPAPRSSEAVATGPDGAYRAGGVYPGFNLVVVRAPGLCAKGFPGATFNALADPSLAAGWSVMVPESGDVERDVVLHRGGSVEGTVLGPDGSPAAGCTVGRAMEHGFGPGDGWEAWEGRGTSPPSGADGAFRVTGLEPGDMVLEARGPGGLRGRSKRVAVGDGETIGGVRIDLEAGSVLAGTILGEDGSPVPGSRVSLSIGQGDPDPARIDWLRNSAIPHPVGPDGRFRIEGLAGKTWTLFASAPGRGTASKTLYGASEEVRLVLPPERTVAGRVLDESGKPVSGASVAVLPAPRETSLSGLPVEATTVTDATGRFLQGGLGEGDHLVRASKAGLRTGTVVAPAGGAEVEVRLAAPRRLTGRILAEDDGGPAPGVMVTCFPAERPTGASAGAEAATGADGSFVLEGLPAGPWVLYVGGWDDDWIRTKREVPAATADVEVRLRRGLTIEGHLVEADGRPVPGMQVQAGTSGTTVSGTDGAFRFRGLEPGAYDVTGFVYRGRRGELVQPSVKGVQAGTKDLRIELPPPKEPPLPEPPVGNGRIRGRAVLRGGGAPPAGTLVVAIPAAPGSRVLPSARTDDRGEFSLEDLGEGTYLVIAGWHDRSLAPVATPEAVEPGVDGIVLELSPAVALSGRLAGPGAAGIRFVRALPEGGPPAAFSWAEAGAGGAFALAGLPEGPVRLRGWRRDGGEVDLGRATAPAEDVEIRVER